MHRGITPHALKYYYHKDSHGRSRASQGHEDLPKSTRCKRSRRSHVVKDSESTSICQQLKSEAVLVGPRMRRDLNRERVPSPSFPGFCAASGTPLTVVEDRTQFALWNPLLLRGLTASSRLVSSDHDAHPRQGVPSCKYRFSPESYGRGSARYSSDPKTHSEKHMLTALRCSNELAGYSQLGVFSDVQST